MEALYAKGQVLYLNNNWAEAFPEFLKVDALSKKHNIKNNTSIEAHH